MGGGGGAWKVAYADFVTAMMAFFLLMWAAFAAIFANQLRVLSLIVLDQVRHGLAENSVVHDLTGAADRKSTRLNSSH